jgi:hypothetical protein
MPPPLSDLADAASSLLSDPWAACRTFLTRVRKPLLQFTSQWNAVLPVHPMFLALGDVPTPTEQDAVAAAAAIPPTTPTEAAILRQATLAGIVPFSGETALLATSPEEFVINLSSMRDGSCVDTVLIGLLRLATVLIEADPTLTADLAAAPPPHPPSGVRANSATMDIDDDATSSPVSPAITTKASDLIKHLYSTCLYAVPKVDVSAALWQADVSTAASPLPLVPTQVAGQSSPSSAMLLVPVFSTPPLPKCKSIVSRRAALGLLAALTRRSSSNIEELGSLLVCV